VRHHIFPAFPDPSQTSLNIPDTLINIFIFLHEPLRPLLSLTCPYCKHVETHEQVEGEDEGRQQLRYPTDSLHLPTPDL